jgi:dTDP-4-dehydrorhamnose 3,5-epimerase
MNTGDLRPTKELPGVRVFSPMRHRDERGFFSEVWRADAMKAAGIDAAFVQINHAFSHAVGTIRALHFQIGPSAQAKLVRCPCGSILDVAVDIRRNSPTFGQHVAVVLSAKNWQQLYIPVGYAHGYCVLEPNTEVIYKVSAYYDPKAERGVAWDDPDIGIKWPVTADCAVLAAKDRAYPRLKDTPDYFPYADYPD